MRYGCVSHLRRGVAMTGSENSNARILIGECCCRTVRFEVADAFSYAMNCHCSNCRRTTGSAFKPFAGIAQDKLRIVRGDDQRLIFGDDTTHDAHCGRCGSLLYSGCVTDNGSMSPWEPWSMPPRSGQAPTFSSPRRRPGTKLRTICRNIGGISVMAKAAWSARRLGREPQAGWCDKQRGALGLSPARSS